MTTDTTTLKAILEGEDRSMGKVIEHVGRKARETAPKIKGFGASLVTLASPFSKVIAAGAGAGFGIEKIGEYLTAGVELADKASIQEKALAQIIKTTGGAAHVTAKQVEDYAKATSEKTGVDYTSIAAAEKVLLTFRNVGNQAGANNDIFTRASNIIQDMSAAGFGSLNKSARLVGKALNDPANGLKNLSRVGIQFTDSQKKQIIALEKSGHHVQAQNILLKELERRMGGVADASAAATDKESSAWENLQRDIGKKLLPAFEKVDEWMVDKGIPAVRQLAHWVTDKLWPALVDGYHTILPGINQALAIFGGKGKGSGDAMKQLGDVLTKDVIPFVSILARYYLPWAATQLKAIITVAKVVGAVLSGIGNTVVRAWGWVLQRFGDVLRAVSTLLSALGHVPGFGWAKDAADKLRRAANYASALGHAVSNIPDHKDVSINIATHTVGGRFKLPDGSWYNIGMRAGGGPTFPNHSIVVGENGPELWTPPGSGHITPTRQAARILAGSGGAGSTSGGGDDRPLLVQLMLDGRVIHEALLKRKREGGVALGLA